MLQRVTAYGLSGTPSTFIPVASKTCHEDLTACRSEIYLFLMCIFRLHFLTYAHVVCALLTKSQGFFALGPARLHLFGGFLSASELF